MKPFRYERPADVDAAVAMLARAPNAAFLAGGTNLVDHLKLGIATPDLLVDVRRLTSDRIEELTDGGVRIGVAVRHAGNGRSLPPAAEESDSARCCC